VFVSQLNIFFNFVDLLRYYFVPLIMNIINQSAFLVVILHFDGYGAGQEHVVLTKSGVCDIVDVYLLLGIKLDHDYLFVIASKENDVLVFFVFRSRIGHELSQHELSWVVIIDYDCFIFWSCFGLVLLYFDEEVNLFEFGVFLSAFGNIVIKVEKRDDITATQLWLGLNKVIIIFVFFLFIGIEKILLMHLSRKCKSIQILMLFIFV
jgi:hypothetical protein